MPCHSMCHRRQLAVLRLLLLLLCCPLGCWCTCLQPAVPENGRVQFTSSAPYSAGSRAKYSCDLGFIHVGAEERTCRQDGTWSQTAPVCAVNVAVFKPVSHASAVLAPEQQQPASLAVDGVLDGQCIHAQLMQHETYTWTVDLLDATPIYAVELLLGERDNQSAGTLTHINLRINLQQQSGQQGDAAPSCTRFQGNIETNVLHTFVCDQQVAARYVSVQLRGSRVRLCEVFVLSTRAPSQFQCESIPSMELLGVHRGLCYQQSVAGNSLGWTDAQHSCQQASASLPVHVDQSAHLFMRSQLQHRTHTNAQFYWIGLQADSPTAPHTWSWLDGNQLRNGSFNAWLEQPAATSARPDVSDQLAAAMAQPFDWQWLAVTANVWNGWICQSGVSVCASPAVPASGGVMISRQPFAIGTSAFYFCSPGFRLVGTSTRTCGSTGVWQGAVPQCHVVECARVSALANGAVRLLNGSRLYGALMEFGCDAGYRLSSRQHLAMCQADGVWSIQQPSCQPIRCGEPPALAHGFALSNNGTAVGSLTRYACDAEYRLVGPEVVSCNGEGRWTPELPVCYDENTINQLLSMTNSSSSSGGGGVIQWLFIVAGVLAVAMLVCASAICFAYRRRKQPDGLSLGTFYTTATGGATNMAYASSNSSAGTNADYADIYVTDSKQMDSQTQIVLPAHLLHQFDSSIQQQQQQQHATHYVIQSPIRRVGSMPRSLKRVSSHIETSSSSSSAYLANNNNGDPTIHRQQQKPYKRPDKFQTMVTRVKQRLSVLDATDGEKKKKSKAKQRPEIVLVGLQASSRNMSLDVNDAGIGCGVGHEGSQPPARPQHSPTPSELMYSFQDADEYDSADDERPVEKSALDELAAHGDPAAQHILYAINKANRTLSTTYASAGSQLTDSTSSTAQNEYEQIQVQSTYA